MSALSPQISLYVGGLTRTQSCLDPILNSVRGDRSGLLETFIEKARAFSRRVRLRFRSGHLRSECSRARAVRPTNNVNFSQRSSSFERRS